MQTQPVLGIDIGGSGIKGALVDLTLGDFATERTTRQSRGYDVRSFEVRARPVGDIPRLRPGMSVLFDWPQ